MSNKSAVEDWEDLFDLICEELSTIATVANLVNADTQAVFFVVDDDYGTKEQKVCILDIKQEIETVKHTLQGLLKGRFECWAIFVAFEDGSDRDGFILRHGTTNKSP